MEKGILKIFIIYFLCVCVCALVWVCMCHGVYVEVRGQDVIVSPLLLPCVSWGLNLGYQVLYQVPISAETSH